MDINEKTFLRWKGTTQDKRKGPKTEPANKLRKEEVEEIIKVSTSNKFMDLAPSQIVPSLADEGKYLGSESTFYRILKIHSLMSHRGKSKEKTQRRPLPLVATGPNQIYSWDITYMKGPIKGQFYYLYMFMDIWSRKIVGQEVHENEDMIKSSKLIEKICKAEGIEKWQLVLHADNGGAMKGVTMLATLQKLGVVPSFSRARVSDDNPYSESLFKTLKYSKAYPSKAFASLEKAKTWVDGFTDWYNCEHLHSGIKFTSPNDRHTGKDIEILNKRKKVYDEAKRKNPNRWSSETRNWKREEKVYLNYLQRKKEGAIKIAS